MFIYMNNISYVLGQYICQIDDDRGIKTAGYLYVEGMS